jgi:hypothetical protein
MTRLTIECPTTGLPVRSSITYTRLAAEPDTVVCFHCPRCSEMHRFTYADATVELSTNA